MNYQNLHQMNLYDVFGENPWEQEDPFPTDRAYMKRLCSKEGREMMPWIEEVCDAHEYVGSSMYDEYPDGLAFERMADTIYEKAGRPEPEAWARGLIQSLLYNEICFRRRCRREFKRHLYNR